MKNLFCTLLLSLLALGATAQKIAVKKNVMTVNGQPYARLEGDGGALSTTQYYVNSVQGTRLFVIKLLSFQDPANASASNPTGETQYLQFIFPGSGVAAETVLPGLFRSLSMARKIYAAGLLKDGALDPQAVSDFVFTNGMPFSARRQALDQSAWLVPASH
jgi:hypothetical protein